MRLAWIALFAALAGTAVAASPLLGSRDLRNGSITGTDLADRSLTRSAAARTLPLRRGPRGPDGPAGPQGVQAPTMGPAFRSANVSFSEIDADGMLGLIPRATHPAPGVYCLDDQGVTWVQATSTNLDAAQRVAAVVSDSAPASCPSDATIRVTVAAVDGTLTDGPFLLALGRTG